MIEKILGEEKNGKFFRGEKEINFKITFRHYEPEKKFIYGVGKDSHGRFTIFGSEEGNHLSLKKFYGEEENPKYIVFDCAGDLNKSETEYSGKWKNPKGKDYIKGNTWKIFL